jgi:Ca2+-binding RTX toxin-like protein
VGLDAIGLSLIWIGASMPMLWASLQLQTFKRGQDTLVLDRTTFTKLKGRKLSSNDFEVVKNRRQAQTSDALITYIQKTGALFYNENRDEAEFGRGGKFADLTDGLKLTVKDFSVVA